MFKTPATRIVFVLFIPVLVFTLSYYHFFNIFLNSHAGHTVKNVYFSILSPAGNKVSAILHFPGNMRILFRNKQSLVIENQNLHSDMQRETLEKNLWREKAISLMHSHAFQSWLDKQYFSVVGTAAQVSAINSGLWLTTLSINKGTAHHVYNGSAVLAANGFAGRITESFNASSSVMLIVHPSSFTGIRSERTREAYILAGTGSGCVLQFVPLDADIRKGDKLITSGLSETIPAGIPVGTVKDISRDSGGAGRVIHVAPYVNFRKIEQVFVLINK